MANGEVAFLSLWDQNAAAYNPLSPPICGERPGEGRGDQPHGRSLVAPLRVA